MSAKLHHDDAAVTPPRCAFVAGATGYTGRALVAELRARGIATVAHVRPDSPRLAAWREHFAAIGATVDATPWEPDAMADAMARHRPDAVFALLGTTRRRGSSARAAGAREDYDTVDYGLNAMLLRATVRGAPGARFVYLSALGVGPHGRGGYLRARWRLEQELRASGLDFTIIRPAFITGPDREERRPAERAASIAIDSLLRLLRRLGVRQPYLRFHSLTATELASAIARHAFDPASAGTELRPESLR
jgi:nucleoside-diphosphate-sugar epimerase